MFKKLKKILRVGMPLAILLVILYVIAYGEVVNRIIGADVTPGDGLVKHADSTAIHILHGTYFTIDNDSIVFADADWGDVSVSSKAVTLDANVVGDNEIDYSEVTLLDFDYQTAWRLFYSNTDGDVTELAFGTSGQYLKSNGASAAPTWDTPGGSGDMLKSTYDINEDGVVDSAETVSHGIISNLVHDSLNANWSTFLDGDAAESEIHDSLNTNFAASANILAFVSDETGTGVLVFGTSPTITSPTISTSIALPAGAIDAAGEISNDLITNAHFTHSTDWGDIEVDGSGNVIIDAGILDSVDVGDDGLSEDDVNWRSYPLSNGDVAVRVGVDDNVDVLYPLADNDHHWYCYGSNSSGGDDLYDTLVITWLETADLDSVVWDYVTSSTTTTTASVKMVLYKQTKVGETTSSALYTGSEISSSVVDTWARTAVAGASISAISAGDKLIAYMIRRTDNNHNASWGMPVPYCSGK